MKKLLMLLFGSVLAISLALPAFPQATGGTESKEPTKSGTAKKHVTKHHATKGGAKVKKGKDTNTPPAPK